MRDVLWLGCPLLAGVGLAAASWGQISWWPSAVLGGVYALRLLRLQPRAATPLVPEPTIEVNGFGVVLREDSAQGSASYCLLWTEVTQVDVLTTTTGTPADSLSFVLVGGAPLGSDEPRRVVVPGALAVASQLVRAMTAHLGALDQTQLLRAISRQGEGRFTLWQRPPQG